MPAFVDLDGQMAQWREIVISRGREFLRLRASELGVTLTELDVASELEHIDALREQLRDTRSRIARREAERREIERELSEMTEMGTRVLEAAEQIDARSRSAGPEELRALASTFVDAGLELAQRLDSATPVRERLSEFEDSLREWRTGLRVLEEEEERLCRDVSERFEIDEPPTLEELRDVVASKSPTTDPELARLISIHREWEERFGQGSEFHGALMQASSVVAATCVGFAGVRGAIDVEFDLCVIDEASKATATEALVPMSRAHRWVLVGDNRQLPPFQEEALLDESLLARYGIRREVLETTLFDFLREQLTLDLVVTLREQRRMLPAIGQMVSHVFYDGELQSIEREQPPHLALALGAPILWLNTSADSNRREQSAGTSYVNVFEANQVSSVLERLEWASKAAGKRTSVVVLTGYAGQHGELERAVGRLQLPTLSVMTATIDAFQGREADVAIFSLTRSNERGDLGFLRSPARINVALSRPRNGLVIVGDEKFVRHAPESPLKRVLGYLGLHDQDAKWEEVSA